MTALAQIPTARPTQIEVSFAAWRVSDLRGHEGSPLKIEGKSLAAIVQSAVVQCAHKDTIAVRETNPSGKQVTHFYAVKRKANATYVWDAETLQQKRVHQLYADFLFSLAVASFIPVEPWNWSPDADVVGVDRSVVEGVLS